MIANQALLDRLRRPLWICCGVFIAMFLIACALQLGVWRKSEVRHGPFPTETAQERVAFLPGPNVPLPIFDAPGDLVGQNVSDLQLSVKGEAWQPHAAHALIRAGTTGVFSHWNKNIYFTLPPDLANDATTSVALAYSIKLRSELFFALTALALGAIGFLTWVEYQLDPDRVKRFTATIANGTLSTFNFFSWLIAALGAIYAVTIVYGVIASDALPTAGLVRRWPATAGLWHLALYSSHAMLLVAALGSLTCWLAALDQSVPAELLQRQHTLSRFWQRAGFPVLTLLLLFLLSGGGWSGRFSPFEMQYMSVGGLLPYSDAHGYYVAPFEEITDGHWGFFAAQRPLAAASRTLTTFLGGFSYAGTLLAQAVIIALAIAFCARTIARSFGIWVNLAFVGFAVGLARPFLITTMTEPLALAWSLFSLAFLIEGVRSKSLSWILLGFALLCAALSVRMGSMFTIPILAVWIALAFGQTARRRLLILAATFAVFAGVAGITYALAIAYSAEPAAIGGNFAYTLCGLAHGTNWTECPRLHAGQINAQGLKPTQVNALFWSDAIRTIGAQPGIFLHSLADAMKSYTLGIPQFFLAQYGRPLWSQTNATFFALLLLFPGWFCSVRRPERRLEASLLLVIWISSVLSSAFVMVDDGWRVMMVTHVFVALALALGFWSPAMTSGAMIDKPKSSSRAATLALCAITVVLLGLPFLTRQLLWSNAYAKVQHGGNDPRVEFLLPAPALAGFVVVPDGVKLTYDLPTMNLATFESIFQDSPIIESGLRAFLDTVAARLPIAIVAGPRIDATSTTNFYAAPLEVLKNRQVKGWRFEVDEHFPRDPSQVSLFVVKQATPLE